MRIVLVGPGRAGQSVAIAANGAGHDVVAVAARVTYHRAQAAAQQVGQHAALREAVELARNRVGPIVGDEGEAIGAHVIGRWGVGEGARRGIEAGQRAMAGS